MSVTAPAGFLATGVSAGLKRSGATDLALVRNTGPRDSAAAVFTTNRFPAAPVQISRRNIADGRLHAVVLNSGGANACTGEQGTTDAQTMAQTTAGALGLAAEQVAVCSTGLIGELLPIDRLVTGIGQAAQTLHADGGGAAAEAILTTDTVSKQAAVSVGGYVIGAMAKGAGMLAPGLATMLVVITTDADIASADLDRALREASRLTFDRTDSDGAMSTNDTVLALASGASSVRPEPAEFTKALTDLCADLCGQLIADAEGAAHEIAIEVTGAASEDDAVCAARAIARSNLFKCAIFGQDPNWGRALAALGTTNAAFDPGRVDVAINGIEVCRGGSIGQPRTLVDLAGRQVLVRVELHAGDAAATILTNDLTYDYIKENAEYST